MPQRKTFHYPLAPCLRGDGLWYVVEDDVVRWWGLGRATTIKGVNVASFHSFRNGLGADANCVYYRKMKLPKSDQTTWMFLGQNYSMDHSRVWFLNREIQNGNRGKSFMIHTPEPIGHATDGSSFFLNEATVDPERFLRSVRKQINSYNSQAKIISNP